MIPGRDQLVLRTANERGRPENAAWPTRPLRLEKRLQSGRRR